jgi:predicted nucleic acid-binding protein
MTDYLIDTNHLSPLISEGHALRSKLLRQNQLGDSFAIATPALAELLYGIQILPRARQNQEE